jgi:hypothetical protein
MHFDIARVEEEIEITRIFPELEERLIGTCGLGVLPHQPQIYERPECGQKGAQVVPKFLGIGLSCIFPRKNSHSASLVLIRSELIALVLALVLDFKVKTILRQDVSVENPQAALNCGSARARNWGARTFQRRSRRRTTSGL